MIFQSYQDVNRFLHCYWRQYYLHHLHLKYCDHHLFHIFMVVVKECSWWYRRTQDANIDSITCVVHQVLINGVLSSLELKLCRDTAGGHRDTNSSIGFCFWKSIQIGFSQLKYENCYQFRWGLPYKRKHYWGGIALTFDLILNCDLSLPTEHLELDFGIDLCYIFCLTLSGNIA